MIFDSSVAIDRDKNSNLKTLFLHFFFFFGSNLLGQHNIYLNVDFDGFFRDWSELVRNASDAVILNLLEVEDEKRATRETSKRNIQ